LSYKIIYAIYHGDHPALRSLHSQPSKNLKFLLKTKIKSKNSRETKNKNTFQKRKISEKINIFSLISRYFKISYERFFKLFNLPVIRPIIPTRKFHYDFIITDGLVLNLTNKKYIYLIEYIGSVVAFNDKILNSKISLKLIKHFLLSKKCKYVFCWSKSSKKMLIDVLNIPEKRQKKFKTIYPTLEPNEIFDRNEESIRLLFISSTSVKDKDYNFFMKGGKLVLEAFEKLKLKYNNLELTFIGTMPEEYKVYYQKIPGINFYNKVPYEKIRELYINSNIFLFPTYGDTFGFTFLEAMAFGLPIICINNNSAASELVVNNKTGFVIESSQKFLKFPYSKYCPDWISKRIFYDNIKKEKDLIGLKNLIKKLEILIVNKDLREKFGEAGRDRIRLKDLSIKSRNKKLFALFDD